MIKCAYFSHLSVIGQTLLIITSLILFTNSSTTPRTEVKELPGFGRPPTRHWSGFIEVDDASDSNLFYYLVESANDPDNDPLLWWMNGGPGASSLVGLFGEIGPLLLVDETKLMQNPYAWNLRANVLYVEFAPGIGYSYCSNSSRTDLSCKQSNNSCSPCISSDSSVATQNLKFLDIFLGSMLFPEYKGRPLFLVGESYAGVYIPTLTKALLDHYKNTNIVNLHGLWITDPCIDNKAQYGWLDLGVKFAYEKGLISGLIYNSLMSDKCSSGETPVGDIIRSTKHEECQRAWRLYDIALAGLGNTMHPAEVPGLPLYIDPLNAYGPSGGPDLKNYLQSPDVRNALNAISTPNSKYHIEIGNNGYPQYTVEWAACSNDPHTQISMVNFYRDIVNISRLGVQSAANLRNIIICSGNIDPVVALHGTEAAVHKIGFKIKVGGDRRPWFFNSLATDISTLGTKAINWGELLHARNAGPQIGGFTTSFNTDSKVRLDFVTVRGSGHMVPAYAPQRSLHMINRMLFDNKDLSPLLPSDWDTATDTQFYEYGTKTKGIFANWVSQAMSNKYISRQQTTTTKNKHQANKQKQKKYISR